MESWEQTFHFDTCQGSRDNQIFLGGRGGGINKNGQIYPPRLLSSVWVGLVFQSQQDPEIVTVIFPIPVPPGVVQHSGLRGTSPDLCPPWLTRALEVGSIATRVMASQGHLSLLGHPGALTLRRS